MAKTAADEHPASDEHPMFQPVPFKREVSGDPTEDVFLGCPYCSQTFISKEELEAHIKFAHPGAEYAAIPAPKNPDFAELLHVQRPSTLFAEGIPLSEVERHNVPTDCWVAINGKVYDLTEFLDRHPGGRNTILGVAGKDGSNTFNAFHTEKWLGQYLRPEAYLGEFGINEGKMSEEYWHQLREIRMGELAEELHQFHAEEGADKTPEAEIEGKIPISEVAKHNKIEDCWVVQKGEVLDLTEFVLHNEETRNPILAMAGTDATAMFNKIPGRFPSDSWNEENLRPEYVIGELGAEIPLSHKEAHIRDLRRELRILTGPSEEERAAAGAAAAAAKSAAAAAASSGEAERFPKLKEIQASKGTLPLFTRADVAKHDSKSAAPYIIVHNKVYDLKPLMGNHPGGDDVLLSRAGTDCTVDFEVFEHSEKSRVRRDQDMLVGEIVPEEREDAAAGADAAGAVVAAEPETEWQRYLRYRTNDLIMSVVAIYLYRSWHHMKPLPKLMYSRALRHMHLIMAGGIFATLGTAQAAKFADGKTKKKLITLHKQTGLAMLLALFFRAFARYRSGIPPRFPGFSVVQFVESQSLRAFYLLALALPVSGVAYEWFSKIAPSLQKVEDKAADERNEQAAKQSIDMHKKLGRFFNLVWLPFHMGYTTAYHASQGRGVWRKVSPFI